MYIELDAREVFEGRGGIPDATADTRIGYLSVNGMTLIIAEGPNEVGANYQVVKTKNNSGLAPFMFAINRPPSVAATKLFHMPIEETANMLRAAWILGGQRSPLFTSNRSISLPDIDMPLDQVTSMFDIRPVMSFENTTLSETGNTLFNYAFQGGGDPFIYTTALLLLNRENKNVYIREKGPTRGLHNGKAVVYRTHSVVSISLSDKGSLRQLIVGDRSSPRGHQVRGTWVNQDKHYCEHNWEPEDHILNSDGSVGKRFHCTKCPQRRTWRETHVRGDASKGWVIKHYEVTR
jgi:hypothetical protein